MKVRRDGREARCIESRAPAHRSYVKAECPTSIGGIQQGRNWREGVCNIMCNIMPAEQLASAVDI